MLVVVGLHLIFDFLPLYLDRVTMSVREVAESLNFAIEIGLILKHLLSFSIDKCYIPTVHLNSLELGFSFIYPIIF